jgi:hypothetical protein
VFGWCLVGVWLVFEQHPPVRLSLYIKVFQAFLAPKWWVLPKNFFKNFVFRSLNRIFADVNNKMI